MEDPSPYGEGEELWWGAGKNNREGERGGAREYINSQYNGC